MPARPVFGVQLISSFRLASRVLGNYPILLRPTIFSPAASGRGAPGYQRTTQVIRPPSLRTSPWALQQQAPVSPQAALVAAAAVATIAASSKLKIQAKVPPDNSQGHYTPPYHHHLHRRRRQRPLSPTPAATQEHYERALTSQAAPVLPAGRVTTVTTTMAALEAVAVAPLRAQDTLRSPREQPCRWRI